MTYSMLPTRGGEGGGKQKAGVSQAHTLVLKLPVLRSPRSWGVAGDDARGNLYAPVNIQGQTGEQWTQKDG